MHKNSALHQVRSCARRARNAQVVCTLRSGRVHNAQVMGTSCPFWSRHQGRVATSFSLAQPQARSGPPRRPSQVAKSIPCRDLPSAQPNKLGHDLKMGSRRQFPTGQVVTSKQGRDTNGQCLLLRRQNRSSAQPGHDFNPWS